MKKILSLLPKIGLAIVMLMMVAVSCFTAYIVFAPDTWPKPFYLMYRYPVLPATEEANAAGGNSGGEGTAVTPPKSQPVKEAPAGPGPTPMPTAAQVEIRPGQGIMIDTGSKIVNLMDPSGRRYLRVGIVLEFAPTDLAFYTMKAEEKLKFQETFTEETKARLPVINNTIITLLASQTFDAVYTAQGKETLRTQIMNTINQQLPEYRVIFVYFTEFVVQ